jgi:glucosamine--fructose-6-phosphate aminotransferase (isomerizing)
LSEDFLSAEIAEQPAVVEHLLREQRGAFAEAVSLATAAGVNSVLIAARGSSDNAARYAQHLFGRFLRLPVALASPSLSTLYRSSPRLRHTLVIGISQSGESPDVCAVLQDAREQRQPTVAITNAPGSPLAQAAGVVIDLGTGPERSVAATKTYTASLAALAALAVELAGLPTLVGELAAIAQAMQQQIDCGVGAAGDLLLEAERCAVTGRGPNYATAFEAALKLKELTGISAEPYSPADLMHGPVAVLGADSPLIAIGAAGPALASVLDAVQAARERGARCLAISDTPAAFAQGAQTLQLVAVPEWLSPLIAILPAQALAAEAALGRGVTLDAPFGLSKVTRTV